MPLIVPDRDDWFDDEDSFPRANWSAVHGWMRVFAKPPELDEAWQQCTRHWLQRLRKRLGNDYHTAESVNFHLLSELAPAVRISSLSFLEQTRSHIHKVLGDISPPEAQGQHVVLRFTATEDYYAYISHFYPDGAYAGSGGMFLGGGYQHIAYPQSWNLEEERRTLVHELSHDLLAHLPLPSWINEALAMAFEADLAGSTHEPLSRDLAARHRAYWSPATIQSFWRGESFSAVEEQELAYSLARILLNLIHSELRPPEGEFRNFVLRADWSDAGAVAAREHLEIELENLVGAFLGPGEWAPHPRTWTRVVGPSDGEDSAESGAADVL